MPPTRRERSSARATPASCAAAARAAASASSRGLRAGRGAGERVWERTRAQQRRGAGWHEPGIATQQAGASTPSAACPASAAHAPDCQGGGRGADRRRAGGARLAAQLLQQPLRDLRRGRVQAWGQWARALEGQGAAQGRQAGKTHPHAALKEDVVLCRSAGSLAHGRGSLCSGLSGERRRLGRAVAGRGAGSLVGRARMRQGCDRDCQLTGGGPDRRSRRQPQLHAGAAGQGGGSWPPLRAPLPPLDPSGTNPRPRAASQLRERCAPARGGAPQAPPRCLCACTPLQMACQPPGALQLRVLAGCAQMVRRAGPGSASGAPTVLWQRLQGWSAPEQPLGTRHQPAPQLLGPAACPPRLALPRSSPQRGCGLSAAPPCVLAPPLAARAAHIHLAPPPPFPPCPQAQRFGSALAP